MSPQQPPQPQSFLPRPSALFKNLGPIEGDYLRNLRGIESESLRRAWIEGDMNAMTGMYFKDWRPHGHLAGEPECAHHVYDPATLRIESWWHLWGSLDWGYIHPTAMQWHRKAPWGQTLTFKELALNRTEPFELGVMLARECKPMLLGLREETPHINFYISPDAWSLKESDFPPAMQMCKGIDNVLGPQSSFAMTMDEAEKSMRSPTEAFQSMLKRRGDQRAARISLIMASTNRVAGWMRMQSLLRFRPLNPVSMPDMEHAHALYEEKGLVSYQEYLNSPEFAAPRECLPGWRVSRDCVNLIDGMRKAVYRPGTNDVMKRDSTESSAGDDSIDASRYALLSEHLQGEKVAPLTDRIEERAGAILTAGMDPTTRIQVIAAAARKESGVEERGAREFGHNRMAVMRSLRAKGSIMTQREPHQRRIFKP